MKTKQDCISCFRERKTMLQKIYEDMGITPEVYALGEEILKELKPRFDEIDKVAEINQLKVLKTKKDTNLLLVKNLMIKF